MDPSQPFIGRYFSPTSTVIKSYLRTLDARSDKVRIVAETKVTTEEVTKK
jgi:hypothetical protein